MNYDPAKLPPRPITFPTVYDNLIYIGKGNFNNPFSKKYNNGVKFISHTCSFDSITGSFHCNGEDLNKGDHVDRYYFVSKDSHLLVKMFPLVITQPTYNTAEVCEVIRTYITQSSDKQNAINLLKIHMHHFESKESKEYSEEIVI